MATETATTVESTTVTGTQWAAGAVGGFLGSIPFGLMMMYVMPPPMLEVVVPAMYGIEGPAIAAGWALHQFHGVVLGLGYVAAVQFGGLDDAATEFGGSVKLGVVYGILTTLVLAVLVMPVWLRVVGFAAAPPFPNFAIPATIVSTVGHVVYAVPVAVAYALVSE